MSNAARLTIPNVATDDLKFIYFDSSTDSWVLGPNPRSRANHTGTQTAATISDFASTVTSLIAGSGVSFDREAGATTADVLTAKVTGDAQKRLEMRADGRMAWSDGTTDPSAGGVNLYWGGASILATDGHFRVGNRLYLGTGTAPSILKGTGDPNGVHVGDPGSIFFRTDGGTRFTVYFKDSGTGNTGWLAWGQSLETIVVALSDETTNITTGTAKVTMRMPFAFTLSEVRSSLSTASSSGLVTVDINETGTTILSTKLSIDASEKTSTTAATAPVISDASLANDAEVTFDIDAAGTGARGLKVYMIGRRT